MVEKASYISRSVLVSKFDGQIYRPKYHEDLVHSEITLPPGGRKNCKIIRNWYLLFSTCQILYSFCKMLYNNHKERDFYEYEYYIEILTVFA